MRRLEKFDKAKYKQLIYDTLNKKEIRCNECMKLVKFTDMDKFNDEEKIPFVSGFTMICNECYYEDDITQGHVTLKNGVIINLYDYMNSIDIYNEPKTWDDALITLEKIEKLMNMRTMYIT